eukprot:15478473-Alexandrium_andersonii.AAC.1
MIRLGAPQGFGEQEILLTFWPRVVCMHSCPNARFAGKQGGLLSLSAEKQHDRLCVVAIWLSGGPTS